MTCSSVCWLVSASRVSSVSAQPCLSETLPDASVQLGQTFRRCSGNTQEVADGPQASSWPRLLLHRLVRLSLAGSYLSHPVSFNVCCTKLRALWGDHGFNYSFTHSFTHQTWIQDQLCALPCGRPGTAKISTHSFPSVTCTPGKKSWNFFVQFRECEMKGPHPVADMEQAPGAGCHGGGHRAVGRPLPEMEQALGPP